MRSLVYLKQSLKVSVQSITLNFVNSDKVFLIYLYLYIYNGNFSENQFRCVILAIFGLRTSKFRTMIDNFVDKVCISKKIGKTNYGRTYYRTF